MNTSVVFKSHYRSSHWSLIFFGAAVGLAIVGQIYLTHEMAFRVVSNQTAHRAIAVFEGGISVLEARVLALENQMTFDLAYARGFRDSDMTASYTTTRESFSLITRRNDGHE